MDNEWRLQKEYDGLRNQWELLHEKLGVLNRAIILETRADEKFRLQKLIEDTEAGLNSIECQLDAIEKEFKGQELEEQSLFESPEKAYFFRKRIKISSLFVGRQEELRYFYDIANSVSDIKILNIHTSGDGGIGKTCTLLKMQEYCASIPENVIYNNNLIDFFHAESRSKLGVIQQVVDNLGRENFSTFEELVERYQFTNDSSEREQLLLDIENAFYDDYHRFSMEQMDCGKKIVIFFDTYEYIQKGQTEFASQLQVEVTEFSTWIESTLFPKLSTNTCLVVSGRYPIETSHSSCDIRELPHFSLEDTKLFWKRCFELEDDSELFDRIGSEELILKIHLLSTGRPILLGLFADWLNYYQKSISPHDIVSDIEEQTHIIEGGATEEQILLFEETLIRYIETLDNKEEQHALTYMAIAYRRMTPELLNHLKGIPLNESQLILLEGLRPLSFIKYKAGGIVLLHDEVRRMIIDHWWRKKDPKKDERNEIIHKLIDFYERKLSSGEYISEAERAIYVSELTEYALSVEPESAFDRFGDEFDIALDDGRFDYCALLLHEVSKYTSENPDIVPFSNLLEIRLRQLKYEIRLRRNYKEALQKICIILDDAKDTEHPVIGSFYLEKGISELQLESFKDAINSFQKAKQVFYDFGEDALDAHSNNWIGYTHYRQGEFSTATEFLNRSQKHFNHLLDYRNKFTEQQRRQLFQGIQSVLANLALLQKHTGNFRSAIHNAETALAIVNLLPRNSLEIARTRYTLGNVLADAGHTIDAGHQLNQANKFVPNIKNTLLEITIEARLISLTHRTNELSNILEYYRAEELGKILQDRHDDLTNQMNSALNSIQNFQKAISRIEDSIKGDENGNIVQGERTAIKNELSEAYFALGELYITSPVPNHWERAEEALRKSILWGRQSQFMYREVDTLESLVTLYYFWNGSPEISSKDKKANRQKMMQSLYEIEDFDKRTYPDLFGKYEITLGDMKFDEALENIRIAKKQSTIAGIEVLKEAFVHYISAAKLMKKFNESRYYIALRIFYDRQSMLLTKELIDVSNIDQFIELLRPLWEKELEAFEQVVQCIQLRFNPEQKLEQINLLSRNVQKVLDGGNFGWALLLNDCIIEAYRALVIESPDDEFYEKLILKINEQSKYYRASGDDYQALQCIHAAKEELHLVKNAVLRQALDGCIDSVEGTFRYRRGVYGKLLEYYLEDELDTANKRFNEQFAGEQEVALELLLSGEEKLKLAIDHWRSTINEEMQNSEKEKFRAHITQYYKFLGEIRFRIGELLTLKQQFDKSFLYFKEAIGDSVVSGNNYWFDSAIQSYINAFYFSGNYYHDSYLHERLYLEKQLERKINFSDKIYPSVMGRLRIIQGDAIFSRYFEQKKREGESYYYVPVKNDKKASIRDIRTMLRYYVEACNFMALHSSMNLSAAIRVLIRRISLLHDDFTLEIIDRGILEIWQDQPNLHQMTDEVESLIQLTKIKSIMLREDSVNDKREEQYSES